MSPTVRDLRSEIACFIRAAGGLEMPDLREKAEACQRRIDALGYRWDSTRLLWRAPASTPRNHRKVGEP